MIHRWHLSCFILFFFNPMHLVFGQSEKPFSGELIYKVTKVDSGSNPLQPANNENEETKVIIYAKDSLLKIVNFSAQNGFQECLKSSGAGISQLVELLVCKANDTSSNPSRADYFFRSSCPPSSKWLAVSLGTWRKVPCDRLASCPMGNKQLLLARLTLPEPG